METQYASNKTAYLVLLDGTVFKGDSFGAQGETSGEVVFNTSMMGYQEILTDPSYKGQLVTMTYPLIGNYGVNTEDLESANVWVDGFIVKEYSKTYSNWRASGSLGDYLKKNNIVGIQNIDTRALTKHIREKGSMQGIISTLSDDTNQLLEKLKKRETVVGIGKDTVQYVTCKSKESHPQTAGPEHKYHIVAYDFGIKRSIIHHLINQGCRVSVVPASTSDTEVLELKPDGIFLSNGPGDPEGVTYASENIKKLIGKKPIFGICLGHQILSMALGAKTYKLKFGHHGGNHPVKDLSTGKIEITAQNHNFAVDADSLPNDITPTHINLYDQTLEGIKHKNLPLFSIQYHPESSPGPHDSTYLFSRFMEMVNQ